MVPGSILGSSQIGAGYQTLGSLINSKYPAPIRKLSAFEADFKLNYENIALLLVLHNDRIWRRLG